MQAILEDAISCFQKQFITNSRRAQRLAREAEEWRFTDDYRWPFSFMNICAALGLEPEYLRRGRKPWYRHRPVEFSRKGSRDVLPPRPLKLASYFLHRLMHVCI